MTNGAGAVPVWVNGKRGSALAFDPAGNDVSVGGTKVYATSGAGFSVSSWYYLNSFANQSYPAIATIRSDTSNAVYLLLSNQGGAFLGITFCGGEATWDTPHTNVVPPTAGWHHVVLTYNGSGAATVTNYAIYLDGVSQAVSDGGTGTCTAVAQQTLIGDSATGNNWDGKLDEVRIYNRTLTASDVANLYDQGTAGATRINASSALLQNGTSLAKGLVGLWTFDGPDVTDKVYDRSGSNFNGYWGGITVGTSSTLTAGKLGQALNLEGTDGYVPIGNAGTNIRTIAFWMKASTSTVSKEILRLNTARIDTNSSSQVTATGFTSPTIYVDGSPASAVVNTDWHHVVVTDTADVSAAALEIGRANSQYFGGKLDDVRIYNRALSASEVATLFKLGTTIINK
jgi:hypothetical protein